MSSLTALSCEYILTRALSLSSSGDEDSSVVPDVGAHLRQLCVYLSLSLSLSPSSRVASSLLSSAAPLCLAS
jgi:hypothetical protein